MVKLKNETTVATNKVRINFVNLFKPRANDDGGDPKYSAMILIPKADTETLDFIRQAQKNAAKKKWGDKPPRNLKSTLRDGDTEGPEDRPEYEDHYFMNVSSVRKPQIWGRERGADGKLLPLEDEEALYGGCYVQVSINAFGYDSSGNKGVSFGINGVRKVADGESLGGFTDTSEDFDDADVEEDNEFDFL